MNKKELEILKIEEDFRDTLENESAKNQKENIKIKILDIKFIGKVSWKDKINGKGLEEPLFEVEKEIEERNPDGTVSTKRIINYYLNDKCIAAALEEENPIYSDKFQQFELDKLNGVKELLNNTSEQEIENNSLNKLESKEREEALEANSKENTLSKKQAEQVKVNGIQKIDLNKLTDGKESLGKKLDLDEYDSLEIIYSDKVNNISKSENRKNTTYSIVGITRDGDAKVLNDEFDLDNTVGNNASREQSKIRADGTATRDNKDTSVFTRKSNGASIGFENNQGNVNAFYYQKTAEENENIGIQIETSKTQVIPIETREIMNKNKGIYQKDKVQNEIEEHTEEGCNPDNVKYFDGDENTITHEHAENYGDNLSNGRTVEDIVLEIYNYENEEGEEKIKELFTEDEVKDKFLRELKENEENISLEQIIENVKEEMNEDAEIFTREHKI